jgi:RNA polymerase sigma factor (sigma-70 family)
MIDSNDKALIAGCVSGNRSALEGLVGRFSDPVYRSIQYVFKTKGIRYSKEDLEDLHNSAFLSIFEDRCRKLRQYKGKGGCSLATWIRLITVRMVIDQLRRKGFDAFGGRKKRLPGELLDSLKSAEPDLLDNMEKAEQWGLIRDRMKDLLSRDRLFLTLHYEEGLSISEVAMMMDISEENVRSIKHRVIERLKAGIFQGSGIGDQRSGGSGRENKYQITNNR